MEKGSRFGYYGVFPRRILVFFLATSLAFLNEKIGWHGGFTAVNYRTTSILNKTNTQMSTSLWLKSEKGPDGDGLFVNSTLQQLTVNETDHALRHAPFPRWGHSIATTSTNRLGNDDDDDVATASNNKISLAHLLQFVEKAASPAMILYVVNADGVFVSETMLHNFLNSTSLGFFRGRVQPTHKMLVAAWKILLRQSNRTNTTTTATTTSSTNFMLQDAAADTDRWWSLRQAILSGGFAFVANYQDWTKCNDQVWPQQSKPVPIFTMAAPVYNCNYSFPIPNYQTISDSLPSAQDWQHIMQESYQTYARNHTTKIQKVVWRGSLTGTGGHPQVPSTNPRWRLVNVVKNQNPQVQNYFDVGFTTVPARFQNISSQFMASFVPMANFQQYAAILDMDGNSWSSRFGKLLCYNSVILKVDPQYVDYFHFKSNPALIPYFHYLPVKFDLSDLVESVTWVLDPRNAANVQQMIQNANAWCRNQMSLPTVARDYWDIWHAYVNLLDAVETSSTTTAEILSNDDMGMTKITGL